MNTDKQPIDVIYIIRKFERTYMSLGLDAEASDMAIIHEAMAKLIESLSDVLPYVVSETLEHCDGNKCRESWCIGCCGEEDATESVAKAKAASSKAYTLLDSIMGGK